MSETLDATFTNLSQLSRAYGAPAVSLAERVIQKTAEGTILIGMILVVTGFVLLWPTFLGFKYSKKAYRDGNDSLETILWLFGAFSFVIVCVSWAMSFNFLHDIWEWTALTDPQLALAHRVFGSMERGY